jgi:hypothetical protein
LISDVVVPDECIADKDGRTRREGSEEYSSSLSLSSFGCRRLNSADELILTAPPDNITVRMIALLRQIPIHLFTRTQFTVIG